MTARLHLQRGPQAWLRPALPLLALGLLCLASPSLAAEAAKAEAKSESEDESKAARATLADKIPPVSGNLFFKKGRFEVAPSLGLSLGDAFFQKYAFGLMINYHVVESVSIGLHGSYLLATPGGAVGVCGENGCAGPTMDDLKNVPGKVSLLAGLDLAWSPFYGKVNVMAEKVLHFDTSIFIGADVIQYAAPGGTSTFTGGGHIGLGERIVFNDFLALRIELRDYMYGATVNLEKESGDGLQTQFQNQLMLELGLSFFLGGSKD